MLIKGPLYSSTEYLCFLLWVDLWRLLQYFVYSFSVLRYGLSRQKSKSQSCTERPQWWVKPAVTICCCSVCTISCSCDTHQCFVSLSSGPSEDESSPAAERPQQADSAERSPKERSSPQASPAGSPPSRSPASSSSDSSSSSSDDEDEHHGALRKIRSSVAQIKVRMGCGCYWQLIANFLLFRDT